MIDQANENSGGEDRRYLKDCSSLSLLIRCLCDCLYLVTDVSSPSYVKEAVFPRIMSTQHIPAAVPDSKMQLRASRVHADIIDV